MRIQQKRLHELNTNLNSLGSEEVQAPKNCTSDSDVPSQNIIGDVFANKKFRPIRLTAILKTPLALCYQALSNPSDLESALARKAQRIKLWEGIETNDVTKIDDALRDGADVNERLPITGCFPLHQAANLPKSVNALEKIITFAPNFFPENTSEPNVFDILVESENVLGLSVLLKAGVRKMRHHIGRPNHTRMHDI